MEKIKTPQEGVKILFFTAPGCGPCSVVYPILEGLGKENPSLVIQKVSIDLEENTKMSLDFRVRSIPTVVFLKNGKEEKRFVGLSRPAEYQKAIELLLA
jgi:thioredoxin 1